jgi:hypothetical protein
MRGGRLPGRAASMALVLLVVIGALTYFLVSGSSGSNSPAAAHNPSASTKHHTTHPSASPSATASAVPLAPVSVAAFGPAGTGQGDNPRLASLALAGSGSAGWQTDWYATPDFAGLQTGTGLLVDLGKPVTVTSAQLLLGPQAGGTLQLRVGDTPSLASLLPVAQAPDTGGKLTVPITSPTAGRYLLIWFTSLPPDNSGTYQATIYDISLSGLS